MLYCLVYVSIADVTWVRQLLFAVRRQMKSICFSKTGYGWGVGYAAFDTCIARLWVDSLAGWTGWQVIKGQAKESSPSLPIYSFEDGHRYRSTSFCSALLVRVSQKSTCLMEDANLLQIYKFFSVAFSMRSLSFTFSVVRLILKPVCHLLQILQQYLFSAVISLPFSVVRFILIPVAAPCDFSLCHTLSYF